MDNPTTANPGKRHPKSAKPLEARALDTLPLLFPDLAGIDIGSREHYVSIPQERAAQSVRIFGCTTPELREMAQWLRAHNITHVVMESTGVYWVPVAMVLEDAGFTVALVDARESHRLSARKSDVHDCQWIRQLYACGLLRSAFRPDSDMLPIRSYWRQRQELVSMCATSLHHMQKSLELMNVQLHKVISDIAGVTGMRVIRAIVEGQRDPQSFLHMIHPNCKSSPQQFLNAMTGHYAQEHVFALEQALRRYDLFQTQIAQIDQQLQHSLQALPAREPLAPEPAPGAKKKKPREKRRKNQCHFDLSKQLQLIAGVDLTRIEGIDALTAFTVITEQGLDMTKFPTDKHFASHLGLCPNNQITGGRVRKNRTRRVKSRAAKALRLAAQSLSRNKTALGAFYRRLKARMGPAKANVAAAHRLAKMIYRTLKYGEHYVARGQDEYENQYRHRQLQNLKRQAKNMGYELLNPDSGQLLS